MRPFRWRLAANLALLAAAFSLRAAASPPINVDLQASFNSPPFIIELLETAAEERPDVYFPILDRIAEGYFDSSNTDKELYERFLTLLQDDQLITDPESLSSLKFALSIRNSAPRIQAHYQFYETSVEPSLEDQSCETWLEVGGKQYCDAQMEKEHAELRSASLSHTVPFDRSLGPDSDTVPVTLYADIASKDFRKFHEVASNAAKEGKSSYRVRYKPSKGGDAKPLVMSGYGVQLALKRTDYIVIDDRQKGDESDDEPKATENTDTQLDDEEVSDMKPLSRSEVMGLSIRAAHFAVASENPLDTLLKMTQDFPKHSATLAYHNASEEFVEEFQANRAQFLPAGFNVLWINGMQVDPRKIDAFTLLDHLRRERRLIGNFQEMGLTSAEAITLLSNPALLEATESNEAQRYDWRDEEEGGNVIIWLNDIEKDKRYKDWPSDLGGFLQRMFPGQLPTVRRDTSNAIIPLDFSKPESALEIVNTIQSIIKRRIAVRWGIVPIGLSSTATEQAKILYHLQEAYGLAAVMQYLEESVEAKSKTLAPKQALYEKITNSRELKEEKAKLGFDEVMTNDDIDNRVKSASSYLKRLGAFRDMAPLFVNGVPIKHDDEWLQTLSQQISADINRIQRGIFEGTLEEDIWLPSLFLGNALLRRNAVAIPASDKEITLFNLPNLLKGVEEKFKGLPQIPSSVDSPAWQNVQLTVIADLDSVEGLSLLTNAALFRKVQENTQLVLIHNGKTESDKVKSSLAFDFFMEHKDKFPDSVEEFASGLNNLAFAEERGTKLNAGENSFPELPELMKSLRLEPGQNAILFNGRLVGPIPSDSQFSLPDLEMLYKYESTKRIEPIQKALENLDLTSKLKDVRVAANLYSTMAAAQVSDIPEGIFEVPPPIRSTMFYDWQEKHTAITIGDNSTSVIQLVAALDPASETAQRWVPILKAISELAGISLKIWMNPSQMLEELPVKRFYRYVLEPAPTFEEDGSLTGGAARFAKIPAQALLNLGMDVPAAWLVSSKESIHDLDNIKLSSLGPNGRVDATYQLEYILIEGHSRDVTTEGPPRGIQLLLTTEKDPHFADTMIMANLGYFQFKANPGYYHIDLKAGRSKEIFNLDSVGSMGYEATPGDATTEVALLSFQGVTLYPRLSRKPGMEEEDVLEAPSSKAADLVQQGGKLVGSLLKKAGLTTESASPHAEINIFSVASGHLYERMLNIMMVSVMRHTKHTVKFWFIEQFLSPSFKSFLPTMAKEYGFQYEMVTYKWPHWLRAQKEKQREIWGYKILFLDVLFPLDLNKVIFVDADQIVRTDMIELINEDLHGAPYGFTPMCDSRTEMEGYRFWKQGYWKNFLRGLPYHISALYVVDLKRFRELAAGDRLRQQYHQLSADPNSLSNLDQDLPNNMQHAIPIHSLDQSFLWCETWCSDESLKDAKTIDLCNNPETKEPKLERARRQVPEWTEYDDEIAELARRTQAGSMPLGNVQEQELIDKDRPASEETSSATTSSEEERPSIKDEL